MIWTAAPVLVQVYLGLGDQVHIMASDQPGKAKCGSPCRFVFRGSILPGDAVCDRCVELCPELGEMVEGDHA